MLGKLFYLSRWDKDKTQNPYALCDQRFSFFFFFLTIASPLHGTPIEICICICCENYRLDRNEKSSSGCRSKCATLLWSGSFLSFSWRGWLTLLHPPSPLLTREREKKDGIASMCDHDSILACKCVCVWGGCHGCTCVPGSQAQRSKTAERNIVLLASHCNRSNCCYGDVGPPSMLRTRRGTDGGKKGPHPSPPPNQSAGIAPPSGGEVRAVHCRRRESGRER